MRILILTQYYPPETGAAQNRLCDLAQRLAAAGHDVSVLTALPSYPTGRIFPEYRGKWFVRERGDGGVRVLRVWNFATRSPRFLPRVWSYVTFAVLSFLVGALVGGAADAVFVESPPLFLGVSGYWLSRVKRARFLFNVSDLWPESAIALGALRNAVLIRWATRSEERLYRRAWLVTGQSRGIVESIRRRCPEARVEWLPNGVAPEFLQAVAAARTSREKLRCELGFEGKFVIVFAGLHGLSQGLENVLRAAALLRGDQRISFLFCGDGPAKQGLVKAARALGLQNCEFREPVRTARMAQIWTAADAAIVPLKRSVSGLGMVPAKLFEAMGAGVPVIAALDGEARRLVDLAGGGLWVEPERPDEIAAAIVRLANDPAQCAELGARGEKFVSQNFNRAAIAEKLLSILRSEATPQTSDETVLRVAAD